MNARFANEVVELQGRKLTMERHQDDTILLLPEDMIADIFRRLLPRSVAVARCVCKAWRALVDTRRLLRLELPHTVGSIITNLHGLTSSQFLCHPSAASTISTNLDHHTLLAAKLGHVRNNPSVYVKDHCNGLLLIHDCVANPATQEWARLPPCPNPCLGWFCFYSNNYLVFDPAVSPHYEVFSVPRVLYKVKLEGFRNGRRLQLDPAIETLDWPPSPCAMHVFSSRTGKWEEKSFVRQGEAVGTIGDMRADTLPRKRYAVNWQDGLYVQCETNFVMRISLSNGKYRVIKPPVGMDSHGKYHNLYLGRSENGVYCALLHYWRLQIWLLRESHFQTEWVLKHQNDLLPVLPLQNCDETTDGPWVLYNVNSYEEDGPMLGDEEITEYDPDSRVRLEHDMNQDYYSLRS